MQILDPHIVGGFEDGDSWLSPIPARPPATSSISKRPRSSRSTTTTRARRASSSSRTPMTRGPARSGRRSSTPTPPRFPARSSSTFRPRPIRSSPSPWLVSIPTTQTWTINCSKPSAHDHPDCHDRWILRGRIRRPVPLSLPGQLGRADGHDYRHGHRRDLHAEHRSPLCRRDDRSDRLQCHARPGSGGPSAIHDRTEPGRKCRRSPARPGLHGHFPGAFAGQAIPNLIGNPSGLTGTIREYRSGRKARGALPWATRP